MFERNTAIIQQKKPSTVVWRTAACLPNPGTFFLSNQDFMVVQAGHAHTGSDVIVSF